MTLAAFLLVRQEAVMGQVTTVSWAPGFLQGSDCCGPNGPAAIGCSGNPGYSECGPFISIPSMEVTLCNH